MTKRKRRVGLLGLFGIGNLGNDGSLEAMVEFLRAASPDVELVCICGDPDLIRERQHIASIPLRWHRPEGGFLKALNDRLFKLPGKIFDILHTIRHIGRLDAIVVPGTGILDDFAARPSGLPLDLSRWCIAARLVGAHVAFVSVGAGPITHKPNRRLLLLAARMATYRSYRDVNSKAFMAKAGFDVTADPIYPDIAFKLPVPADAAGPAAAERSGPLTVGVGVMSYSGWSAFADDQDRIHADYVAKIVRFVTWLLDGGHQVRLIVGETSDAGTVEEVMADVTAARPGLEPGRITSRPPASLHDLMHQIAETDLVVATRFHNVVCALKLARPTISIGYAQKNDDLLADVGLGAFCQHIERLDVDLLCRQFEDLAAGREGYAAAIAAATTRFRDLLAEQDRKLLQHVLSDG
jgi:polysaccharide pyruvyl transferase WcaK-like protein